MENRFESVEHVRDGLKKVHYLSDDGIAGVVLDHLVVLVLYLSLYLLRLT